MRQLRLWTVLCSKVRGGTDICFSCRLCPVSWRAHKDLPLTVWNPVLCAMVTVFGAASKTLLQGWGLHWRQSRKWVEGKGVNTFSFSTSPHIVSLHLAFQREENQTTPLCFIHKEFELIDHPTELETVKATLEFSPLGSFASTLLLLTKVLQF